MKIVSLLSGLVLALTATGCLVADEAPTEAGSQEAGSVKAVTAEEAKALLASKDAPTVIDIRTAEEFKEGHIEGAKQIDFKGNNFQEELAKLDRSKAYLFHCRSGGRSSQSLSIWKELGFKKLYHLDTGILGWEKAEGKTVKGE